MNLVSLEPLEPAVFDVSGFQGMTPSLLQDLLKLTFISDEKLSTNPLFPKPKVNLGSKVAEEKKQEEVKEQEATMARLERTLDQDIARYCQRSYYNEVSLKTGFTVLS